MWEVGMKVEIFRKQRGLQVPGLALMVAGLVILSANAAPPPPPGPPPAPVLTEIAISGAISMDEQTTEQYVCTASYSDGTSVAVTAIWSVDSVDVTIDSAGLLSAGDVDGDQNVTITASFGGKTDTHVVAVVDHPVILTGIAISGPMSLDEGATAQYTCTASYSDGASVVVVPEWSESSDFATINGSGALTAGNVASDQNVTVSASFGGKTDTHAVTINYVIPVLEGIEISGPASLDEETTAQYACTAIYSDGTSAVITPSWSENSAFATIGISGLLSAEDVSANQSMMVSASYEGKSDEHAVTINHVLVLASLVIAGPESVEENTTAQYACTAHYTDGTSSEVEPAWSVDLVNGSIDGSGLLSIGNIAIDEQATVRASFGGQEAMHTLSIMAIGNQVVFPLSGFGTNTMVYAVLWDSVGESNIVEEFSVGPDEFVVENVEADRWYWLGFGEYDEGAGTTNLVHGRWIWM